jgi:16S rRNA (uracil1498-N3)-methyltransferase
MWIGCPHPCWLVFGQHRDYNDNMSECASKARLYIDMPLRAGDCVDVPDAQRHYLVTVLRLGVGAALTIFNGRDGEWSARITGAGKKQCQITIDTMLKPQINCLDLWLLFAPVKKARLDFMAQKASELGVSCIWPVRTDYCQISRVNDDRLAANAIEAAEQTERMDIAEIRAFEDLTTVLPTLEDDRLVIWCDEASAGSPAHNIAAALQAAPPHSKAAILIGPEGGFSPSERKLLAALKNCLKISLGTRILRADTAAIAALSCYQSICGDWQG